MGNLDVPRSWNLWIKIWLTQRSPCSTRRAVSAVGFHLQIRVSWNTMSQKQENILCWRWSVFFCLELMKFCINVRIIYIYIHTYIYIFVEGGGGSSTGFLCEGHEWWAGKKWWVFLAQSHLVGSQIRDISLTCRHRWLYFPWKRMYNWIPGSKDLIIAQDQRNW